MSTPETTTPDRTPPRGLNLDPADYVDTYLGFYAWIGETFMSVSIGNYLQNGDNDQSKRAQKAKLALMQALVAKLKPKGGNLPDVFTFQNEQYVKASLERVFNGKGAPDEIQSALWLASACDLLNPATVKKYADECLGMDCGGLVATYWGIGRPTAYDKQPPFGRDGVKPRMFWDTYKANRRGPTNPVQVGDAAVFFQDVKNDDPDKFAIHIKDPVTKKDTDKWDTSSGSQAFHIGIVAEATLISGGPKIALKIAESSGAARPDGCNGVNVRQVITTNRQPGTTDRQPGNPELKTARNLVYVMDGANRIYFVGCGGQPNSYLPNKFGAA